jgi:hypothetical protein
MSKCDSCQHYEYCCGVATQLSKLLNKTFPTRPTCYCHYANVSWERKSAEVKKPKGIPCNYIMREMHCTECNKQLKSGSDIWLKLTSTTFICKKCGKEKESHNEQ